MIVLDIETTGLDFKKCGIWQIGAIEFENPKNYFLEEARIDNEDEILNYAGAKKTVYEITGKKDSDFRNPELQTQKKLLENFFRWIEKTKVRNFLCEGPQFDVGFILTKARKYNLEIPFYHRSFDLHTISQLRYFQTKEEFLIKENHSDMGLPNTLQFCGMQNNRKSHNALEDCKLEAECFSRLLHGKGSFPEYSQFPVPDYLKQN